jgi:hypothetical protein
MIVRIQGEGQWELGDSQAAELDRLDDEMQEIVSCHDEAAFQAKFGGLLDYVRGQGRALRPEEIVESDLILPPSDATLDEVKAAFVSEGATRG